MQLTTERSTPVLITLLLTQAGNVEILANDTHIAYICHDGSVNFYYHKDTQKQRLLELGFKINGQGQVQHNL